LGGCRCASSDDRAIRTCPPQITRRTFVLQSAAPIRSFNAIQNHFLAAAKIPIQIEFLAGTGISITSAGDLLQKQDQIIREFPEVESVFGTIGRSNSATDNAPLDGWLQKIQ
jgi:Cu/Ag efflux pump CusA